MARERSKALQRLRKENSNSIARTAGVENRRIARSRGSDAAVTRSVGFGTAAALSTAIMNDFDDEDTQPFIRASGGDDELGLEAIDDWFWSDAEAAEAQMLDAMP
jgi:hypothetical protein